ncbi:MAG: DHHW family protein [Oscillospiraceae bacterium]
MKNKSNLITIITFIAILFSITALNIFSADKEFSENENRYLSQKPEVSLNSVLRGEFTKKFEQYLNDQFIFREAWIRNKNNFQKSTVKKDINGVYLCKDGYLMEKCLEHEFDNAQMLININSINDFAKYCKQNNYNKFSVIIAPNASLILKDKLPKYATNFDQDEKFDTIKKNIKDCEFVDIRDALKLHKNDYIFYKTDHHWTSKGAFLAYQQWCEEVGAVHHLKDEFKITTVTDSFRGTLYSKLLDKNSAYDSIDFYRFNTPIKYSVSYDFGKKKSDSIFSMEKLKKKDKYASFLGGNYPEIKITTENKNDKNLIIFKDSFANSFVPFLLKDYENISIIDLRYFRGDVKSYMRENNITEVLVLYNIMNFSRDKNIVKLGV